MNLDPIEDLVRRYLAAGVTVVVVLAGPVTGTEAAPDASAPPSAVAGAAGVRDGGPDADGAESRSPDGGSGADADRDGGGEESGDGSGEGAAGEEAADREDAGASGGADGAGDDPTTEDAAEGSAAVEHGAEEDAAEGDGAAAGGGAADDGSTASGAERDPADAATEPAHEDAAGSDDPADPRGPAADGWGAPADRAEGEVRTAAERFGWGLPEQVDEFTTAGLDGWEVYTGPGHRGRGERSRDALSVGDGVLTISGDARGTTGGMCWGGGQRYGRWEARVRAPAADPAYHALLLLWPDADDFPTGGQVDFLELTDPGRETAEFWLHHGEDGDRVRSAVRVDAGRWHTWAVEWTPDGITGYVDGEAWFSSTDPDTLPPGPMHLCVQLDFFPADDGEVRPSRMDVDWVRQYAP